MEVIQKKHLLGLEIIYIFITQHNIQCVSRDIAEAQGTPCSTDTASAQCVAALHALYLELLSC